ncbi:MAG TPA: VOC family protein [Longimicrobium sp.]|nr:VOC family protein [Longimicrobium sp.]
MPITRIEHVAFNVAQPVEAAAWYVRHLGMRIARYGGGPTEIHFLADAAGASVLEFYRNPAAAVPDYAAMHPMQMHIAFLADDADAEGARLQEAGAVLEDTTDLPDGSRLVMMRDPWGVPIQIVRRATPLLAAPHAGEAP